MPLNSTCRMLSVLALLAFTFTVAKAAEPPVVRSKQSGAWSDKGTWDLDRARVETSSFARVITSSTTLARSGNHSRSANRR